MTIFGLILRILNTVLMIGIPAAAALLIYKRGKSGFRPIWIGAVVFVLSQVGHIPFNQFLMIPGLRALGVDVAAEGGVSLLVLGVVVGLSAGVFEEVARFLALKFWLKKDAHTLLPVKYGIGHGGIEAIIFGFIPSLGMLVLFLMMGNGSALSAFDSEQKVIVESLMDAYRAVPWQLSLLPAWERVSAMAFHIGASIIVYKGVREKKPLWLLIAVFGHTAINAFAVIFASKMDIVLLEGIIFLFSAGWLYWAWRIREIDPEEDLDLPVPDQVQISAAQVTSEQIEESRYD